MDFEVFFPLSRFNAMWDKFRIDNSEFKQNDHQFRTEDENVYDFEGFCLIYCNSWIEFLEMEIHSSLEYDQEKSLFDNR